VCYDAIIVSIDLHLMRLLNVITGCVIFNRAVQYSLWQLLTGSTIAAHRVDISGISLACFSLVNYCISNFYCFTFKNPFNLTSQCNKC